MTRRIDTPGEITKKTGARVAVTMGVILESASVIAMAFTNRLRAVAFVLTTIVLRAISGVGVAFAMVAGKQPKPHYYIQLCSTVSCLSMAF